MFPWVEARTAAQKTRRRGIAKDLELQAQHTRIIALEDELERTKLRRFGVPAGVGLGGVMAVGMWDAIVPGALTTGGLTWVAAFSLLAFAGLLLNERSCRRASTRIRSQLVASHEQLERLLGRRTNS